MRAVAEWLGWNAVFFLMNVVGMAVLAGIVYVLKELEQPWFIGVAGLIATAAACGVFVLFLKVARRSTPKRAG